MNTIAAQPTLGLLQDIPQSSAQANTPPSSPPAVNKRKRSLDTRSCPVSPYLPPQIRVVLPGSTPNSNPLRHTENACPLDPSDEITALRNNQANMQHQITALQEQNRALSKQILQVLAMLPPMKPGHHSQTLQTLSEQNQPVFYRIPQPLQIPQDLVDPLLRVDYNPTALKRQKQDQDLNLDFLML
ncbi:hypothetical protein BDR26DRAFT_863479 [Obelidium mucronatum]|nr:hypothetical protein BDR26DRAFT_863479 [Obelidium mucronatum]